MEGVCRTVNKACEYCGNPFWVDEFDKNEVRRLYCSDFCRSEAWREKAKERIRVGKRTYNVGCEICGKIFLTNRSTNKTCSPECHHQRELRLKREQSRKRREDIKNGIIKRPEKQKKVETLTEVQRKAQAAGMTYGKYMEQQFLKQLQEERERNGRTKDVHKESDR